MSKKEGKNAKSEANRKDIDFIEHTWPEEQLCAHFETHADNGLTAAGYRKNVERFGRNQLTPPKQLPPWIKFLLQFANFFSGLLIAGGILCFVAFGIDQSDKSNLYLGVVLLTVVIITAVFSHFQESKSEKLMEGFKNLIPRQCKVVRDGSTSVVEAVDLVPGDLVLLEDGQQVPADIRVLISNDLKVDNSSLTGESEPQDRTPDLAKDSNGNLVTQPLEARNLCFYTTMVAGGNGKGIVIGTGDRTVMGQIAGLTTETDNEETPIRKEIKIFIKLISAVAITLGIVFLIIGFFLQSDQRVKNVVFSIGIIVANVPEGLLLTVTVSLAATAMRMHEKNVLVKNLESVETLGSTTVIASDKTGTLTQNRMTVQHAWYDGQIVRCPSCRNLPQFDAVMKAGMKGETMCSLEAPTFQKLAMVAAVCNNSTFQVMNPETGVSINLQEEMRSTEFNLLQLPTTGDASESGLIKFVNLLRDIIQWRAAMPKLFEIKFNSTNKWQLSIHRPEDGSPTPVLVLKGAPERVIKMCNKILINGEEVSLTDAWLSKFTTAYEALGGMGERVLGFAYKNMHGHNLDFPYTAKPEPNFKFDDLTFAGLFSLIDPPKEGVPEAVAKCKNARIKVYMVTGDHPITAVAIAKQVGIIDQDKWDSGNATVVKGDDIREWMELDGPQRQTKFDEALSHEQIVWARVSPAHKLLIVENAQRRGEVVAVTGDGVNDAPALKKGDIGVAMGISGKDVSKEAADMILLDDNFASIVNGVEEGRLIFDNLKKSISYTLTSNIPEIAPFLCFITIQIPLPLSTVLILCVDLGTDMIPAISMAHEEKEADIMERPPRNSATDRLVNAKLISFAYAQIGIMQACAGFFTYMVVLNDYGFTPQILLKTGFEWEENQLICDMNGKARPHFCGFGCNDPEERARNPDGVEVLTAFGQSKEDAKNTDGSGEFCLGGCATPLPGFADPFVEFTSQGFRGFEYDGAASSAEEAVCGRSCDWYWRVRGVEGEVERLIAASETVDDPNRYILNRDDLALFGEYCGNTTNEAVRFWGFPGRESVDGPKDAPTGGYYWWNGEFQVWPNSGYQKNALYFAQSAYFTSIVVVQWADLIISKTRKLSVFQQGMTNRFMNFGLLFETLLAVVFNYVPPLNQVFGTRPLHALHWFPGVPWSMLIFTYDETRKYLMRSNPGGFLDTYTYW